jgi:hypothetical protein
MLAHGFTIPQVVQLVRAGLATATAERVIVDNRLSKPPPARIIEAGLQALTSWVALGGRNASRVTSQALYEERRFCWQSRSRAQ